MKKTAGKSNRYSGLFALSVTLVLLGAMSAGAEDGARCNVDEIDIPAVTDRQKVGAEGCKTAYYALCEELVEQAQENCSNICQRFRKRRALQPFELKECVAEPIDTTIDAFNETRHCKFEAEDKITNCTLDYDCSCKL